MPLNTPPQRPTKRTPNSSNMQGRAVPLESVNVEGRREHVGIILRRVHPVDLPAVLVEIVMHEADGDLLVVPEIRNLFECPERTSVSAASSSVSAASVAADSFPSNSAILSSTRAHTSPSRTWTL